MKQITLFIVGILFSSASLAQKKIESLKISWPEEYNWKTLASHDDKKTGLVEMIPAAEKPDKWTIFATMMSFKDVKIVSTNKVVQTYKESSRKESPRTSLTVLENNDSAAHKYVIFKIETESFPEDPRPESQLYYSVQGESTLYVNFVAVREKELSGDFVSKWTKIFKGAEFVYKDAAAGKSGTESAKKESSEKKDKKK
ncbi:MAG TPA: hypothetical protein PL029_02610 [Bacteroidia bacterium]|nr:hypothetical protein [Bacteroidia bacterium]